MSTTATSSSSSSGSDPQENGTYQSSSSSSSNTINPASAGMRAFNALAGYIFGANAEGRKMSMTTPVFSDTAGTMQFVVASAPQQVGEVIHILCVVSLRI
eukprot:GHUV01035690.1.p2 GENE.GHUV01035690.1~~GHUV01035690.1.p2  ORF type:complete len:100 (+),score=40.97 GHUV01035690.1:3-302(+)